MGVVTQSLLAYILNKFLTILTKSLNLLKIHLFAQALLCNNCVALLTKKL